MECKYCKNVFSSKANLNNHQKTAQYCLKLREQPIKNEFICKGCGKGYSRQYHLLRHESKCKTNEQIINLRNRLLEVEKKNQEYKYEVKNLREQLCQSQETIANLQKQMQEVALKAVSRPTTTKNTQINNFVQNLQPVTRQVLKDNVKNLTIEHIKRGPEGYAEYALNYPLKDRIVCVDYARRKIKFKDEKGNIVTDPEMSRLVPEFFNSIKEENKKLIIEENDRLKDNFAEEVDRIVEIYGFKMDVDKCSEGEKTEFQNNFVKEVCSKTTKGRKV